MPSHTLDRKGKGLPSRNGCQEQSGARHQPASCFPSLLGSPCADPAPWKTVQTPLQSMTSIAEADVRMPSREPTVQKAPVCLELPAASRPLPEEQKPEDYPCPGKRFSGESQSETGQL